MQAPGMMTGLVHWQLVARKDDKPGLHGTFSTYKLQCLHHNWKQKHHCWSRCMFGIRPAAKASHRPVLPSSRGHDHQ